MAMDWRMEKLLEKLRHVLFVVFAVLAYVTGYVLGSFSMTVMVFCAGVVFTLVLTLPEWPTFEQIYFRLMERIEGDRHPRPQQ